MFKNLRKKLKGLKDRFYLLFRTKYANQKYLDSILKELVKSGEYMLNIEKLKNEVSPIEGGETLLFIDPSKTFDKAIRFLLDRKYIDDKAYHAYRITYEGLIFIENGGFVQDVKQKKFERRLNNFYLIGTFLAAVLSVCISIWALRESMK